MRPHLICLVHVLPVREQRAHHFQVAVRSRCGEWGVSVLHMDAMHLDDPLVPSERWWDFVLALRLSILMPAILSEAAALTASAAFISLPQITSCLLLGLAN